MKQLIVRPIEDKDKPQLEEWRVAFEAAGLELPHGWSGRGTETVVVEKPDGSGITLSLTGTKMLAFDPLIRDPNADPLEVSNALRAAEYALAYRGAAGGCVDAFIAVPRELASYIDLLKRRGYEEVAENCIILRRSLLREREDLLTVTAEELAKP
jgi:hypothetical protein